MGTSLRYYLFADHGLKRLSRRLVDELIHDQDVMPQYAGTKAKGLFRYRSMLAGIIFAIVALHRLSMPQRWCHTPRRRPHRIFLGAGIHRRLVPPTVTAGGS
jgi:hypothetical protein